MVIERHFSLSIELTAYLVYVIAWCLVRGVLLALGALASSKRQFVGCGRVRAECGFAIATSKDWLASY